MEQTAVEWLVEQLNELSSMGLSIGQYSSVRKNIIEQAKAMEKEQIMDAHLDGQTTWDVTSKTAEKYYNETFKSE